MSSDMFARAFQSMSGCTDSESTFTGLKKDATDMQILDYIVVSLCSMYDPMKMAFHGGYTLNKIIKDETPRGTVDVDFSIQLSSDYDKVKCILKSIGDDLVGDGLFESYSVFDAASTDHSGGIKLVRSNTGKRNLGVDVGVRNIDHGLIPINICGCDTLRFSVERMLSDKISALHSIKGMRRPKDLYDLYIITNCFNVNLGVLRQELDSENTMDWTATPINQDVILRYEHAYSMLHVRVNGADLSVEDVGCPFKAAIGRLQLFMSQIDSGLIWDHVKRSFISE